VQEVQGWLGADRVLGRASGRGIGVDDKSLQEAPGSHGGRGLLGLMMDDVPLTTNWILKRAEHVFGDQLVWTRTPSRSLHRYSYRTMAARARQLADALAGLGVRPGDRVATLAMNHHQHLELYFGVPAMGAVLHTVNPRLSADDLAHILGEAQDRVVVVDQGLWPVWQRVAARLPDAQVVVVEDGLHPLPAGAIAFEALMARGDAAGFRDGIEDDRQAAAMCYTSGTTGRPKGVLYSHRSLVLHALAEAAVDSIALGEREVVLPAVPMFHVNAWGLPYGCALHGAAQVLPGADLSAQSLLSLLEETGTTFTAGVPTVWLSILAELDAHPGQYDLHRLHTILVGGAAVPARLLEGLRDRHGLHVLHAWGMTETTPLGSVARVPAALASAPLEETDRFRLSQGRPAALVDIRARSEAGLVPWDGVQLGELEVRGPWVARHYFDGDDADKFTEDGWFRTGDVVSIDPLGYVTIHDRVKDLVKSGGEWISSVALENALMSCPGVAEAAVVAAPHPLWQERPVAVLVSSGDERPDDEALRQHLSSRFAKWWVPDAFYWVDAIPRTATGKFLKSALRERFRDTYTGDE